MDTQKAPGAPERGSERRSGPAEPVENRLLTVEREGLGESLVFLARTRNSAEMAELNDLLDDLKAGCHVRLLSRGPVMAAAVKVIDDPDGESTAELMKLLETLGARYSFFKLDLGLHPTLNRLIEDMALDTGSQISPSPQCSLCGRPEPFPTRLTLEEPDRKPAKGLYCSRCVARFEDQNERQLIAALLHTDRKTFAEAETLEVSPAPSRKGNLVRYPIRRRSPLAATG